MTIAAIRSPHPNVASPPATPIREIPRYTERGRLGALTAFRSDPLGTLLEVRRHHADIVDVAMGPSRLVMVYHPDAVKHILVDHHQKYNKQTRGYDSLRLLLGDGLVTSEGSFWRRQRRIAQPAFHKRRLDNFAAGMQSAVVDLAQSWEEADGQSRDVSQDMMRLTLRLACETLFAYNPTDGSDEVGAAVTDMLAYYDEVFNSFLPFSHHLPTTAVRRGKRALRLLDKVVQDIIDERRQSMETHLDLLGMFMDTRDEETGETMNDRQLRDEVLTMLMAGHETTANALGFGLMLLSQHPGVMRKLQAEVDTLVQADGTLPKMGFDILKKLPYTDQVLKEIMRLYPPVWAIARTAAEDDVVLGYRVPKGSWMILTPYVTHRDPRFWTNPQGFDPERFSEENRRADRENGQPKLAYYPFAAGPRKCIGDQFARLEAIVTFAELLSRFDIELDPSRKVELDPSITIRPKNGIHMRPRKRQH